MLRKVFGIVMGLMVLHAAPAAGQQILERLVMPGDLTASHADLEATCEKCHLPFQKTSQATLCLQCHEDIAADIEGGLGFHGRQKSASQEECRSCHTDHKGRDANIAVLDTLTFDHAVTDFPLEGRHVGLSCTGCHSDSGFKLEETGCVACHADEEPHNGQFDNTCGDCHSPAGWSEVRFDHAATDFPLTGKHTEAACRACHVGEQYTGVSSECVSCHLVSDIHAGRLGRECADCHAPEGWAEVVFDHGKATDFPLTGRHQNIECTACHRDGLPGSPLEPECASCHRGDDIHAGLNGNQCQQCHTADTWRKSLFDHATDTDFPLREGHASLSCNACHVDNVYEAELDAACVSCHRGDDVHAGSMGEACADCHQESGWSNATFDHDTATDFPLTGRHAMASCQQCHANDTDPAQTPTQCNSCHEADDVHDGLTGDQCQRCHNSEGWLVDVTFDHDLSAFPLIGLHALVPCEQCHLAGTLARVDAGCENCHADENPHGDSFAGGCGQCHTPNDWSFWDFDHDTQTDYPLSGRHADIQCEACHQGPLVRATRGLHTCADCHRADDVHEGAFGASCDRCHTTDTFTGAVPQ
ncbi:MAG: cytochrome C [Gammaproteobacteria bacterium]|nr:cytochrome C [Gammaproteobacteria bacterium]